MTSQVNGDSMTKYSLDEGRRLVSAARSSIELFLKDPRFEPEMIKSTLKEFSKPDGVFVTLRHYPNEVVRGHAGFSEPVAPLGERGRWRLRAAVY